MFPPFLAYYGALQGGRSGQSLITEAYNQVSLYRQNLFDANASLWRHQANGTNPDLGHWATGECFLLIEMKRLTGEQVMHGLLPGCLECWKQWSILTHPTFSPNSNTTSRAGYRRY